MSVQSFLVLALAALLIGLSKGGFGAVVVGLITPMLSQIMPVPNAVAMALPFLILGDLFALKVYWMQWDQHQLRLLLPLSIVGVIVGMYFLVSLPNEVLRPILGFFTLGAVIYRLISRRLAKLHYHHQNWHGYLTGFVSGFGSGLANVGAPPFTAYMLLQEQTSPRIFMGTTTLFFAVVNAAKLPGVLQGGLINSSQVGYVILAIPFVPLGVWLGQLFVDWIRPDLFEWFMIGTLIFASLLLLFTRPAG